MFDSTRRLPRALMDRAPSPEDRRAGLARMKQTLVTARMGLDDLRKGIALTRQRLEGERRELETVRRRKGLAAGIDDAETVALAEKYEVLHAERTAVLERKLDAQSAELAMAEREVAEMTTELRLAVSGVPTPGRGAARDAEAAAEADSVLDDAGAGVAEEIDALGRARARAEKDADAERRLEELKRRMGK